MEENIQDQGMKQNVAQQIKLSWIGLSKSQGKTQADNAA